MIKHFTLLVLMELQLNGGKAILNQRINNGFLKNGLKEMLNILQLFFKEQQNQF